MDHRLFGLSLPLGYLQGPLFWAIVCHSIFLVLELILVGVITITSNGLQGLMPAIMVSGPEVRWKLLMCLYVLFFFLLLISLNRKRKTLKLEQTWIHDLFDFPQKYCLCSMCLLKFKHSTKESWASKNPWGEAPSSELIKSFETVENAKSGASGAPPITCGDMRFTQLSWVYHGEVHL